METLRYSMLDLSTRAPAIRKEVGRQALAREIALCALIFSITPLGLDVGRDIAPSDPPRSQSASQVSSMRGSSSVGNAPS